MKKVIVAVLIILTSSLSYAQETGTDTYTIQRLLIYNSDGNILLEKHANGWMTPALRHNLKITTGQGLKNLASEFGLEISKPKLAGIFMFISEYKLKSSFRQHYVCELVGGKLKLPVGKLDAKWVSPKKAIEMMSDPKAKLVGAVKEMTEQILNYRKIVWGGAFSLCKENGVTAYKILEHFYPIADRN